MANKQKCPNSGCGKILAADLRIDANARGFSQVALGWKCGACATVQRHIGSAIATRDKAAAH